MKTEHHTPRPQARNESLNRPRPSWTRQFHDSDSDKKAHLDLIERQSVCIIGEIKDLPEPWSERATRITLAIQRKGKLLDSWPPLPCPCGEQQCSGCVPLDGVLAFVQSWNDAKNLRQALQRGAATIVAFSCGYPLPQPTTGWWRPLKGLCWGGAQWQGEEKDTRPFRDMISVPNTTGMPLEDMTRHIGSLSSGDRIWFETCTIAGDKIVAPHLNTGDGRPAFLSAPALMRRFACDRPIASALSAAFEAIDVSEAVVSAYAAQHRQHRPLAEILTELQRVVEMLAPDPTDVVDDASEYAETDDDADDEDESAPSSVGYHVVGTLYDTHPYEPDWIDRQPSRLRQLIRSMQSCPDVETLSTLGQQLHNQQAPSRVLQAAWDVFHARQVTLDATQPLSPPARRWRQRILTARSETLGALGRELYKAQHNSSNGMADWEWGVIWRLYRATRPMTRPPALTSSPAAVCA